MMKPWQAPSNKTPSKRRKEVGYKERQDPRLSQKKQNPKWVTKGHGWKEKNPADE